MAGVARFRWEVAEPWDGAAELARSLRTGTLIAQLLHNRGIDDADDARTYLAPKLTDLHDPETLSGAVEAAEAILATVRAKRKIVLYGDYDVDGMTGVAILYRGLQRLGAEVDYYIPHRIDEGYGLNLSAIETIAAGGAELVITVDCGIRAIDCAARAAELGLKLIVTDHHSPGDALPTAAAIVHPALGSGYPNAHLCGAGVALKLAWQLCRAASGATRVTDELKAFLLDATCMAALGTVADVVPLIGENRALVMHGLRNLPATTHPGLRALMAESSLTGRSVGAYDVGFRLAPRLNAAGRMGHAREAAELLIRADQIDCRAPARALSRQNTERQKIERALTAEAGEMVVARGLDGDDSRAIVLAKQGWHAGVIGIVASRLVGRFHRPAVLICLDGAAGRGSARSIPGYSIAEAFTACSEHLISHGGHAMAAGLTIDADRVDAFAEALASHARERITAEMLTPVLPIDAEVNLADLSVPIVQQIESMAPFGAGNAPVMLAVRDATIHAAPKRMGARGDTLSLLLSAGRTRVRCVGFGMGNLVDRLPGVRTVHVAGEPSINRYAGRVSAEMMLKDVRWD